MGKSTAIRHLLGFIPIILAISVFVPLSVLSPTSVSAAQSSACTPSKPAAQAGTSDQNLQSGRQTRRYLLHVPSGYDPARGRPLVISLHALISPPGLQMAISGFDKVADEHDFIVAFPEGTGKPLHWNVLPFGTPDDLQFMRDLIIALTGSLCIDPARTYVNGFSDGAAMTYLIACKMADQIAAVGIVSGADFLSARDCNPSRPMPLIMFHGDADPVTKYQGYPGLRFPSIPQWAADWAARNGCDPAPVNIPPTGDVHGVHYQHCTGSADVILYTISGGGHTWPGGMPTLLGKTSKDINASEVMWQFYEAHSLAANS